MSLFSVEFCLCFGVSVFTKYEHRSSVLPSPVSQCMNRNRQALTRRYLLSAVIPRLAKTAGHQVRCAFKGALPRYGSPHTEKRCRGWFRLTCSSLLRCYFWETLSALSKPEIGFDCESSRSHTITAYDFMQMAGFFLDHRGSRSFLGP